MSRSAPSPKCTRRRNACENSSPFTSHSGGARWELHRALPGPLGRPAAGGRSAHLVVSERGFRALAGIGLDGAVREAAIPLSGRAIHPPTGPLRFQP